MTFLAAFLFFSIALAGPVDIQAEVPASSQSGVPANAKKLIRHYKDRIAGFEDNHIVFRDGSRLLWDDGNENKSFQELLDNPDIEDMFHDRYKKRKIDLPLP